MCLFGFFFILSLLLLFGFRVKKIFRTRSEVYIDRVYGQVLTKHALVPRFSSYFSRLGIVLFFFYWLKGIVRLMFNFGLKLS